MVSCALWRRAPAPANPTFTDPLTALTRAIAVALLALAAPAALAQVDPAGLGARRDTFAAAAPLRLSAPALPRSLAVALHVRDSTGVRPARRLADSEFSYDPTSRTLSLTVAPEPSATVVVAYRTLDLGLPLEYRLEVDTLRAPPGPAGAPVVAAPAPTAEPVFADVRLRRSGSISRGLIAGNNRDLAVESGLRMELSGQVAEGVNVEAVLTDASTPILPEGTTQQLSEFDRVYVRISGRDAEARLGDVDLALGATRFANLSRRVQGAAVSTRLPAMGLLAGGRVMAAGAAARGVFRSQSVPAAEGVQGPYRLTGNAGEAFVIVVPASERIYLDGERMERGETADYIIDYATGEVTFTSRRLITAERRITADFEYTSSGFTRTLAAVAAEASLFARADSTAQPRLTLRAAYLREGDAAGISLALSGDDLDAIAASGDGDVLVPGEERVPFDPASPLVLYARRDTLFAGVVYSIFVPAVAATDSVYRVRFTRVAAGTGSYRRGGSTQNGVLFRWVGPSGGDYIPFRRLPRPERRRLFDLRADAEPLNGLAAWAEWASSGNDLNTLSALDAGDDAGQAAEAGVELRPLLLGRAGSLAGAARAGWRQATFAPLDRTRPVDFGRTWNVDRGGAPAFAADTLTEGLLEASARWAPTEQTSLAVEGGAITLDDPDAGDFYAARGALVLAVDEPLAFGGYLPRAAYRLDVADSRDRLTIDTLSGVAGVNGRFVRGEGLVRSPFLGGRLTPSVGLRHEHRAQRALDGRLYGLETDSVGSAFASALPASYAFVSVRPGLAWSAPRLDLSAGVEHRTEREPLAGALAGAADAIGADAELRWRPGGPYGAEGRVGWRSRRFREAFREIGREDAESLALRWTARAAPLRRAIEATATYEALTERAPVLQEAYVLVGPELGTHVWRDGEGEPRAGEPDGVAQVDEFFPETTPLEGTYARTYVPGDDLFPAIGVQAHLRVRVDPARLVGDRAGAASALARAVALTTTVDVRERTREDDLLRVLLLDPGVLQRAGADSLAGTLAGRFRLQQEVSLLPANPRYGGRLAFAALSTTSRLAAGLERRRLRQVDAEGRLVALPGLTMRLRGGWSRDRAASDAFLTRTFDLTAWRLDPEVTWVGPRGVSLTAGVAFADRTNAGALAGQATGARMWRLPVELRLARVGRLAATARAEWASVDVRGAAGAGLLSYELTEGRGAGTSYLWGATLDYTLTRYLRASAFYDGRAPASARAVHTFRMQLSASF